MSDTKFQNDEEMLKKVEEACKLSKEISDEITKTPFWNRSGKNHKIMERLNLYTEYEKSLLDIANVPFYGRSNTEHTMLKNSGFYTG
jgi:hypothetical protein